MTKTKEAQGDTGSGETKEDNPFLIEEVDVFCKSDILFSFYYYSVNYLN